MLRDQSFAFGKVFLLTALGATLGLGCASQSGGTGGTGGGTGTVVSTGTGTGTGGASACSQDCSKVQVPTCYESVCNEGQLPAPTIVGQCAVVAATKGTTCDDGLFCTVNDACDKGVCKGGGANDCGMMPPPCTDVTCNEATMKCSTAPSTEGSSCMPADLCKVSATCQSGQCVGLPRDCSGSPYAECNTVACNPANGNCEATPDATKNGIACALSGDICENAKTCAAGVCGGGTPKDCSALNQPCANGVCDPNSGACVSQAIPAGGTCSSATDACHLGVCNGGGVCTGMADPNGTACSDHDSCTANESCTNGTCGGGTPVAACSGIPAGFDFESCPNGWTLAGELQCGTPTVVGPSAAHGGVGCLGTVMNGNYANNDDYLTTTATSPDIDLTATTAPFLSFWVWAKTEANYDGANVKVSSDNGATFTLITNVNPAYDGLAGTEQAWMGDHSAAGWRLTSADVSSFAGQHIRVRFAFRSDSSNVGPGVYIDDFKIVEAATLPILITTIVLPDAHVGQPYAATATKIGGSSSPTWSISSGTNDSWLTINPATGVLGGTPMATAQGPVTVTLKVQEPTFPSNVDYRTIGFTVQP